MNETEHLRRIRLRLPAGTATRILLAEGKNLAGTKFRVIQLQDRGVPYPIISLVKYNSLSKTWNFLDVAPMKEAWSKRIWDVFHSEVVSVQRDDQK